MARLFFVLASCALLGYAFAGEGYGAATEPPPPPTPPPYDATEPPPPPPPATEGYGAMPAEMPMDAPVEEEAPAVAEEAPIEEEIIMEEPEAPAPEEEAPVEDPVYYYEEEPEAPIEEEAPAEEAPAEEPIAEEPMELIDEMPMTEEITYTEPVVDEVPAPNGGYRKRRRMVRRKIKRTFMLKRAQEADMGLRLLKNCRDHHANCEFWAAITVVKRNGRRVRVNECRTNPKMREMDGCPRSCDVCTPNRAEFRLRRHNARVLRRRRLAKKNRRTRKIRKTRTN